MSMIYIISFVVYCIAKRFTRFQYSRTRSLGCTICRWKIKSPSIFRLSAGSGGEHRWVDQLLLERRSSNTWTYFAADSCVEGCESAIKMFAVIFLFRRTLYLCIFALPGDLDGPKSRQTRVVGLITRFDNEFDCRLNVCTSNADKRRN